MIIKSIRAVEFLSFRELDLPALDLSTNIIIGPNGAGKTNLIRAIVMVRDVINLGRDPGRQQWTSAHRQGSEAGKFHVEIEIELEEQKEQDLLTTFLRASLEATPEGALDLSGKRPVPKQRVEEYRKWIEREITSDRLRSLFSGTMVVTHEKSPADWWDISYRFAHGGQTYEWVLESRDRQPGVQIWQDNTGIQESKRPYEFVTRYLEIDEQRPFSHEFELEHLLPNEGSRMSQAEVSYSGSAPQAPANMRFAQYMGVDLKSTGRSFHMMQVFAKTFSESILVLEDIRGRPRLDYSMREVEQPGAIEQLGDGSGIPLYLYRLKNGTADERRTYREIRELFHELTREKLEVSTSPTETGRHDNEERAIRIEPLLERTKGDIPVILSGAGTWESLVVSVFLCHPGNTVAFLDEPALNLHPILQRHLAKRISDNSAQSFIVTHSPYLLTIETAEDLRRIIRLYKKGDETKSARLESEEQRPLTEKESQALLKELRASSDVGSILFSSGVLFVEGETEQGLLPVWFDESQTAKEKGSPTDLNLAILAVNGQTNFAKYVSFAERFKLPWAILCDGPAIRGGMLLEQLDIDLGREPSKMRFDEAKENAEQWGIFTLASEGDEEIENFPPILKKAREAMKMAPGSKVRRARAVAETTPCPPEIDELYGKVLDCLGLTAK